jgi:predicted transcriptional regulator YdeE
MKTMQITEPMLVLGIPLRTRNDRAFQDIPAHWQRFGSEKWLERIPNRADGDVYAVYTHHAHEGVDNHGDYTLIVGARVTQADAVPAGLASAVIPAGRHAVFEVEAGRHDKARPSTCPMRASRRRASAGRACACWRSISMTRRWCRKRSCARLQRLQVAPRPHKTSGSTR